MTLTTAMLLSGVTFLAIWVAFSVAVIVLIVGTAVTRLAAEVFAVIVGVSIYCLVSYFEKFMIGAKSIPDPYLVRLGWVMWWRQVNIQEIDDRVIFWRGKEDWASPFIDSDQCVIMDRKEVIRGLKIKGVNYVVQDVLLEITFNPQTAKDHVPFYSTDKSYPCFYFVFAPTLVLIGWGIVALLIWRFK